MGENLAIISKGYLSLSEHERMSRGITLHEREAVRLAKILVQRLQMDEPQTQTQDMQQGSGEEYQEQAEANGTGGGLLF